MFSQAVPVTINAIKEFTNASRLVGVMSAILLSTTMLFSTQASAECACFCVNGELQTMCSTVEEAQGNPTLCGNYPRESCPTETSSPDSASYDEPAEGATNCRDIRVFDSLHGGFTSVKACDVLDAS